MAYAIMRAKKHKATGGGLKVALMHLYRERETPNADPTKANLWFEEDGEQTTKAAIARLTSEIERVNESRGRKMRKDAVVAIEYVMTTSPEWFSDNPKEREKQADNFAKEARKWLEKTIPDGKVIAAQVHMDETTPHLSIFITPTHRLSDDKFSFSAREFLGGYEALQKQQDSFAEHMKPLGLERGKRRSQATHESVNRFYGRLKQFEGQKSELVDRYRAEIDKLDKKLVGGKGDLVELAKLMADDLATLQSNYKRTIAEQSSEAESKRLQDLESHYEHEIGVYRDVARERKEALISMKANLDKALDEHDSLTNEFNSLLIALDEVNLPHELSIQLQIEWDRRKEIHKTEPNSEPKPELNTEQKQGPKSPRI